MALSALQKARYAYTPKLPPALRGDVTQITVALGAATTSVANQTELKALFPNTFGAPIASVGAGKNPDAGKKLTLAVVLSGGQAPGGHNVIAGLYDGLKKGNKASRLLGAKGGPKGLIDGSFTEITDAFMDEYRNTGGFDMIGSGRDKIEKAEDLQKVVDVVKKNGIDGVVIIGGDDSNTNAAVLAEYFKANKVPANVVGCPKTIDGDLKNEHIETSFGFDTAAKTYSELIGNIGRDANSAKKYWHFIKLMGRSASHIGLECALQTQPNVCLISEEVEAKQQSLASIVEYIAGIVAKRQLMAFSRRRGILPEPALKLLEELRKITTETTV